MTGINNGEGMLVFENESVVETLKPSPLVSGTFKRVEGIKTTQNNGLNAENVILEVEDKQTKKKICDSLKIEHQLCELYHIITGSK